METQKYDAPKYEGYFERQLRNEVAPKSRTGQAAGTRSCGRDRTATSLQRQQSHSRASTHLLHL